MLGDLPLERALQDHAVIATCFGRVEDIENGNAVLQKMVERPHVGKAFETQLNYQVEEKGSKKESLFTGGVPGKLEALYVEQQPSEKPIVVDNIKKNLKRTFSATTTTSTSGPAILGTVGGSTVEPETPTVEEMPASASEDSRSTRRRTESPPPSSGMSDVMGGMDIADQHHEFEVEYIDVMGTVSEKVVVECSSRNVSDIYDAFSDLMLEGELLIDDIANLLVFEVREDYSVEISPDMDLSSEHQAIDGYFLRFAEKLEGGGAEPSFERCDGFISSHPVLLELKRKLVLETYFNIKLPDTLESALEERERQLALKERELACEEKEQELYDRKVALKENRLDIATREAGIIQSSSLPNPTGLDDMEKQALKRLNRGVWDDVYSEYFPKAEPKMGEVQGQKIKSIHFLVDKPTDDYDPEDVKFKGKSATPQVGEIKTGKIKKPRGGETEVKVKSVPSFWNNSDVKGQILDIIKRHKAVESGDVPPQYDEIYSNLASKMEEVLINAGGGAPSYDSGTQATTTRTKYFT